MRPSNAHTGSGVMTIRMSTAIAADWLPAFRRDGYFVFGGLAPVAAVEAARRRIGRDLAENYDPARQTEYDHQSYCPDIRSSNEIENLLTNRDVRSMVDAALGWERIRYDHGQIAIRG